MASDRREACVLVYDDDNFLDNLTRDEKLAYFYLSLHTDRIGVVRSPFKVLKSLDFTKDEVREILNHLCENGYLDSFDSNGNQFYIDRCFYVHNTVLTKEAVSPHESLVKKLYNVKYRGDKDGGQKGDGIYYRKEKTPIDADSQSMQGVENASNIGEDGYKNNNGFVNESQYSENDFNENLFSDEELQAVIEECPKEYFDGDISSIEVALNECLLNERDGLTPQGVVMATHKYYNPNRKPTREGKFGKTLTLHEFLSDSTFVLAVFLSW